MAIAPYMWDAFLPHVHHLRTPPSTTPAQQHPPQAHTHSRADMPAPSHPPFKVADLVDTFSGPWGSDACKNAPLKVLEGDFR